MKKEQLISIKETELAELNQHLTIIGANRAPGIEATVEGREQQLRLLKDEENPT